MIKASIAGLETTFDAFKKRACARAGQADEKLSGCNHAERRRRTPTPPPPPSPPAQSRAGRAIDGARHPNLEIDHARFLAAFPVVLEPRVEARLQGS